MMDKGIYTEDGCPRTPSQRKKDRWHKPPHIHVPTSGSLLWIVLAWTPTKCKTSEKIAQKDIMLHRCSNFLEPILTSIFVFVSIYLNLDLCLGPARTASGATGPVHYPGRSKYPIFKDPGPKYHEVHGF